MAAPPQDAETQTKHISLVEGNSVEMDDAVLDVTYSPDRRPHQPPPPGDRPNPPGDKRSPLPWCCFGREGYGGCRGCVGSRLVGVAGVGACGVAPLVGHMCLGKIQSIFQSTREFD